MFHIGKIQKTKHFNIWPFFGHFWENSAKTLPQICTAPNIFTRPLLSYATKELASWEHCHCHLAEQLQEQLGG
jgi:hypothetical protein